MSADAQTVVLIHGMWMTPRSWDNWVDHYTDDAVFDGGGEHAVEGREALLAMAGAMRPLSSVSIRPPAMANSIPAAILPGGIGFCHRGKQECGVNRPGVGGVGMVRPQEAGEQ